jgi:hypothetical protein
MPRAVVWLTLRLVLLVCSNFSQYTCAARMLTRCVVSQDNGGPGTGAGIGWRKSIGTERPTAVPMRGTTKRPQTAAPQPQRRARRRGLSARRSRKMEMPPPKTKRERDARKVARAVGETVEYRDPDVADNDDRDGIRAAGVADVDVELHREQLGFPSQADPFGVAVPTGIAQYSSRPSTAPSSFLSRPIKLNEMQEPRRAGSRNTPLADASSRLAAIEHRQSQLKQQAERARLGGSDAELQLEEDPRSLGGYSHHSADTMLPGKEQFRARQAVADRKFAVAATTHPHNAPVSAEGRRIR